MDDLWISVCKGLWVCCGKAVEKFVEKPVFCKFAFFGCEKTLGFARKSLVSVGKVVLIGGKVFKGGRRVCFAVSTIST